MTTAAPNDPMAASGLLVQVVPCFVDLERETGGVANIVRQICLKLADKRKRTLLLCGNTELGKTVAQPGFRRVSEYLSVQVFAQRGHPMWGPTTALKQRIAALAENAIFHVHTCFSAFTETAMRCASRRRIPYVFTPHGKLSREALGRNRLPKILWWNFMTKAVIRRAARIGLSSSRERESLLKLGLNQNCAIVPNGYELPEGNDQPPSRPEIAEPYILFLGYLDPRKQPEFLVRVFAQSKLQNTHRLVIAGPDSYGHRAVVEAQVRSLGVSERVAFTGQVAGVRKWGLLRHAACVCLPSLAEGMPVVLAEALGAGTPSIYSTNCNFPELAQRGAGIELNGFSSQEWAKALEGLCDSESLQKSMRESANLIAPEFTWQAIVEKWAALYAAVEGNADG